MPSTRLHPLHPRTSLRKLRTAFSPSSPASPSNTSTSSTSPLSATTRASSRFSGFNFDFDHNPGLSPASPFAPLEDGPASRRAIRRKKSMVEVEQEEERTGVRPELTALVEPRPCGGASLGGIEEVLEGRV